MTTIVTRSGKGSPLTNTEVDTNFTNLNSAKLETTNNLSDVADVTTARGNLVAAKSGANTDITSVALTTGTISAAPTATTDIANKLYVDATASGLNFHPACNYATTAALSAAYTYNNGTAGVGATITANAVGTLTIDGYTFVSGDVGKRILVKNETGAYTNNTTPSAAFNGVYTLTTVGTAGVAYVLTRATDYDTSGAGTNEVDEGDFLLVLSGSSLSNSSWVQQTPLPITVGTTSLTFTQFAAPFVFTYPDAGIVNSTGSAWGTSYSTTGSGTVVALATSPTFVTPVLGTPTSGNFSTGTFTWPVFGIANGGTGATTVSGAQTNLQVDPAGTAVALAIALG